MLSRTSYDYSAPETTHHDDKLKNNGVSYLQKIHHVSKRMSPNSRMGTASHLDRFSKFIIAPKINLQQNPNRISHHTFSVLPHRYRKVKKLCQCQNAHSLACSMDLLCMLTSETNLHCFD